jgi:hypothetical protein
MKRVGWLMVLGFVSACGGSSGSNGDPPNSGGEDSGGSALGGSAAAGGSADSGGSAPRGGSSGAATGGTSVGPDATLDDYSAAYTDVLCKVLGRCYPLASGYAGQDCVAAYGPIIEDQLFGLIRPSIDAGTIVYHPEALPQCLRDWENASCDVASLDVPACDAVFTGTLARGTACQNDLECAGRQCMVGDQCPGTCGELAQSNEPCSSDNACDNQLACRNGGCVPTAKLGEACDENKPCRGYTYCYTAPTSEIAAGICVVRTDVPGVLEGERCEIPERLCTDGLVCTVEVEGGTSISRCRAKVAASSACLYSFPDACPGGQYCNITTALGVKPAAGTCQPVPALGEQCIHGEIFSAPCAAGQLCDRESERCILGKRLNEACSANGECFSTHCSAEGECATELECEEAAARAM